jgi:hypothetical protein
MCDLLANQATPAMPHVHIARALVVAAPPTPLWINYTDGAVNGQCPPAQVPTCSFTHVADLRLAGWLAHQTPAVANGAPPPAPLSVHCATL